MWKTLLEKMFTSRKFVVMLATLLVKALAPTATKWGVDLSALSDAVNEYLPLIITWLVGQSAVDVAAAIKTPAPDSK